jgi:hypothetical protein
MKLSEAIRDFKSAAIEVFAEHHSSGMGNPKFHVLDHLGSDIELCGTTGNYDAAFYESGHKVYTVAWGMTSRRRYTGQGEAVGIVARRQGRINLAAAQMQVSEILLREAVVNKLLGKRNLVCARITRNKTMRQSLTPSTSPQAASRYPGRRFCSTLRIATATKHCACQIQAPTSLSASSPICARTSTALGG